MTVYIPNKLNQKQLANKSLTEQPFIRSCSKQSLAFYRTEMFISVFTRTHCWSLSWLRWKMSTVSQPTFLKLISIASSHLQHLTSILSCNILQLKFYMPYHPPYPEFSVISSPVIKGGFIESLWPPRQHKQGGNTLYTPWQEVQDYEVCVYLEMHTYIRVSIWKYFHSQFSTLSIIHTGKVKRKILDMRNLMWLILMSVFTEVIPLCWATRYAQAISQNLRVLCFDWLHLCISAHCQ